MYGEADERPPLRERAGVFLNRAEAFYLKLLRAAILIIATFLLGYAAWLAISSTYKLTRSPDSVIEEQAAVGAEELTDAEMPVASDAKANGKQPSANPHHRRFYRTFAQRYYNLYRTKFEPFRQSEDKQLKLDEFDDSFLNTAARLAAVSKGELNFEHDKADLETLLTVMTEAAEKSVTSSRLKKYHTAKKVSVSRQVERTRTTYREGWDSNSTRCHNWYMSPVGCSVTRPVRTNYTETVTTNEFPKGTQSHTQIFQAFQNRYFQLLQERRDASAAKAESERQTIMAGFVDGKLSLMTALQVVGGFLALMFFFLLIAIERHQRRLASDLHHSQPTG
jgi:hypothetical protein